MRRLQETGEAIVAGVERCLPGWAVRHVERMLDAWGRLGTDERSAVVVQAQIAGRQAAARVVSDLRALFRAAPEHQRTTPLEIVRTAYREPTEVLGATGVPPVVRDQFDERAWPDDRYGLVPRTLADLGDEALGPLQLAWGLAKAEALRRR